MFLFHKKTIKKVNNISETRIQSKENESQFNCPRNQASKRITTYMQRWRNAYRNDKH